MNLLEFQAKELLSRYGVAIPRGRVAGAPDDAERVAVRLGLSRFIVKAQVHAGDRMAAGGIRFAADPIAVRAVADGMLGRRLATSQTGPQGQPVRWVYIEEQVIDARHLYIAILLDEEAGRLVLMLAAEGGDDIEERARTRPDLVVRVPLSADAGNSEIAGAVARIGLPEAAARALERLARALVTAAHELDAVMIEINPLALTSDGRLIALDAKIALDDNALFRHPELAALHHVSETEDGDLEALEAQRHQINYVRLDGDIGVVVNGAGLALATLDLLTEAGGRPANFMDIRTTASSLDIAHGFGLIAGNERVRAVLINIHGGGMQRCDTVAEGIAVALRRAQRPLPLVVRFAGNNADFATTRLADSGASFETATNMWDGAQRAVAAALRGGG